MDIEVGIKFDKLPFPDEKDVKAVDRYIKAFEDEFGENYRLSSFIDPSNDWEVTEDGTGVVIEYEPRVEKLERIKLRRELKDMYKKAIKEGNKKELEELNHLRFSDNEEDDEWNENAESRWR